jgi:hypothetical protein
MPEPNPAIGTAMAPCRRISDRKIAARFLGIPAGFGEKVDAAWRRAQQQLAASIAHVPLVETSHDISFERPDVVIASRPSGAAARR